MRVNADDLEQYKRKNQWTECGDSGNAIISGNLSVKKCDRLVQIQIC